jgi:hypothetical protein
MTSPLQIVRAKPEQPNIFRPNCSLSYLVHNQAWNKMTAMLFYVLNKYRSCVYTSTYFLSSKKFVHHPLAHI